MATKFLDYTGLSYVWNKFKAWCNATFMHLNLDEVVTGVKTYNVNNQFSKSKYTDIVRGTTPSSSHYSYHEFLDKNGARLGHIAHSYSETGTINTYLSVMRQDGAQETSIGISYLANGNVHSWAPIPDNSSNSDEIATTSFVKAQGYLSGIVPITSGGTGASTRVNAIKSLLNSPLNNPDFVFTLNSTSANPWSDAGYTSINTLKTIMGVEASNLVHTSGNEYIAGNKVFQNTVYIDTGNTRIATTIHTNIDSYSKDNYHMFSQLIEKTLVNNAAKYYGFIRSYPKGLSNPDCQSFMQMTACLPNAANTSSTWASLGVGIDANNIAFATAPATSTNRTSEYDIVTRGFIANDSRIVRTSGAQDIYGSKKFHTSIRYAYNSTSEGVWGVQTDIIRGGAWKTQRTHYGLRDYRDQVVGDFAIVTGLSNNVKSSELQMVLCDPTSDATGTKTLDFYTTDWTNFIFAPDTGSDNLFSLGKQQGRWRQIYAGSASIYTSDERCKNSISSIPDYLFEAWDEIEWLQYKFNDAVEEKGDKARTHIGTIAQQLQEIFSNKGININEYGFFCYDEWEEEPEEYNENGKLLKKYIPKGNRYSLRYEEALCLEAAYQRHKNKILENRISELETQVQNMLQILESLKGA